MSTLYSTFGRSMRSLAIGCAVFLLATSATSAQNRRSSQRPSTEQRNQSQPQDQQRRQDQPERFDPAPDNGGPRIDIIEPWLERAQGSLRIVFTIHNARKRLARVKVEKTDGVDAVTSKQLSFSTDGPHEIIVKLFKGSNWITLIGFVNDDPVAPGYIEVECVGKWCKEPFTLTPETVASVVKESAEAPAPEQDGDDARVRDEQAGRVQNGGARRGQVEAQEEQDDDTPVDGTKEPKNTKTAAITIDKPKLNFKVKDIAYVDSYLTVAQGNDIKTIQYDVKNAKETFVSDSIDVSYPEGDKPAELKVNVRILKGTNTIRFFNAAEPGKLDHQASTVVICEGEECASDFLVATFPTNSRTTRGIVGFEQAGASSAPSKTNPFLDFFFTAPLRFGSNEHLPFLSAWGQTRFSTTPEQIGAAGVFPSNLASQITKAGKAVDLVQSFDYLAGLEVKLFDSDKSYPSLIPGIDQRVHFYLAGGGGAISPLSSPIQSNQIYKVPDATSPQRQLFIDRFGTEAANKKFIGFVFPDRDRFLRQYYGGIRLKTFFYRHGETEPINSFPAILDLMVGQNEAVTGGRFKQDITDDTGKIIGRKRSYVLRLDAFYPLPIRDASFLYLYGTAMMKVGGGGVRITTPLFLDSAESNILLTNNDVFIAPNLQLNRDYYKIGIGVNLIELFNRKRSTPK